MRLIEKIGVLLTESQKDRIDTVRVLFDQSDRYKRSGRSFMISVALFEQAYMHPGQRIRLIDHWPGHISATVAVKPVLSGFIHRYREVFGTDGPQFSMTNDYIVFGSEDMRRKSPSKNSNFAGKTSPRGVTK